MSMDHEIVSAYPTNPQLLLARLIEEQGADWPFVLAFQTDVERKTADEGFVRMAIDAAQKLAYLDKGINT